MILVAIGALACMVSGCSGKYPAHTPPGTYTIPITATGTVPNSNGPTTHTLNITLIVTP